MKTLILENPETVVTRDKLFNGEVKVTESKGKDITDYPIEEATPGQDGEPTYNDDGSYTKTGRTFEWTIRAGEQKEFPAYVANYLKGIYPFLEIKGEGNAAQIPNMEAQAAEENPIPKAQSVEGGILCPQCGKTLTGAKGYALHLAHAHPEILIHG